jgi:hypothetical protein
MRVMSQIPLARVKIMRIELLVVIVKALVVIVKALVVIVKALVVATLKYLMNPMTFHRCRFDLVLVIVVPVSLRSP